MQQTNIEFHSTADGFQSNPFVVAVNGSALLAGQIHSREPVHMIAEFSVMPGIGTLYHQIRCYHTALPGIGYRVDRHAVDLAYVWQVNESDYYSFGGADPTTLRSVRNQVILSYGVRF